MQCILKELLLMICFDHREMISITDLESFLMQIKNLGQTGILKLISMDQTFYLVIISYVTKLLLDYELIFKKYLEVYPVTDLDKYIFIVRSRAHYQHDPEKISS